ncbi:glycosyl transferase GT4 family protein [uncultured Methanobrevibacter sp.]|uniref:glycosyl transferase GT4 family protein n=1 Tax=uncultured Methanobrevibacter sp. TaxID=253161 RepID=UPI00260DCE40
MRKVILIAFYFNQINEIASKRLRALAKYLPEFGWEVIVIAPDLGNVPLENDSLDSKIVITDYEDMFSHYLNKFKFKKGNTKDVSFEGLDSNSNSGKDNDRLKDSSSVSNPLLSKAVSLAGEIFAYPDGMKYWYEPAFEEASKIIESEDISAIISSSWPITCHTIAKDLKKKYDIPWVADLRDLWNLNPYVSHSFIREHFELNLEKKTFENVDALTSTSELAKETLSTLHPDKRIEAILSGYDEDDFKVLDSFKEDDMDDFKVLDSFKEEGDFKVLDSFKEDDMDDFKVLESSHEDNVEDLSSNSSSKLKFIYAGSLYGGKRDPELLFKAIRELEDESKIDSSKISIEFYGDRGNLDEIGMKYGLSDILKIGGRISHDEVLKKQADSDVLLLISWNDEKEKIFIPGKLYEYFALRKPVLSIGYKEGSLNDLIKETNVGYHVSDLNSTKEAVLGIYNEFKERGSIKLSSDADVEKYSMRNMASNFAKLLNELN